MATVNVNDIEMYYEQHGEGEDLLLITGLNASHLAWAAVLPLFTQRYRITILDNRGAGLTSKPKGPYSIEQMADDTAGLMDAIGLQRAHVLGHSMGGAIAQQLAIRHPEKINKLILYATTAKFDARCLYAVNLAISLKEQDASEKEIAHLVGLPWGFSKQFMADEKNVTEFSKLASQNPYPMTLEASRAQTEACTQHDTRDLLTRIEAWTMIMAPEEDVLTPPCDSYYMAARIPNARVIEISGYAHCWHFEAPQHFCDQVYIYLRRQKV
jgi:pimeloyl-ACP methyl ester carboxylesterase